MTFLQGALVVFAAALLTGILWEIKTRLYRRSVGGKKTRVTVIVTSEGSPGELEQSVKGLLWLMETGAMASGTDIVIKDAGMDGETAHMARILVRENPSVRMAE